MQAIRAIVDTYVRLRNEGALLALKNQRRKVLASCDAKDPLFARLRDQCLEEIAEIEAGLERLRPPPVVPDPQPMPPENILPPATEAKREARWEAEGLPPPLPVIDPLPAPAPADIDPPAQPTPIQTSPFLAEAPPPIPSDPSPAPIAGDPLSIAAPKQPPQPFTPAHVAPSLLASTLLAASLSSKLPGNAEKPESEVVRLQIAIEQRMKSQT